MLRIRPIWVVVVLIIIVRTSTMIVETVVSMALGLMVPTGVGVVTSVLVAAERRAVRVRGTAAMIVMVPVVNVVEEREDQDARNEDEEPEDPCFAGSSRPPQGIRATSHPSARSDGRRAPTSCGASHALSR